MASSVIRAKRQQERLPGNSIGPADSEPLGQDRNNLMHTESEIVGAFPRTNSKRASCVVVTWFSAFQVGYLDFSYRIRALSSQFDLTIVSRAPLTQRELLVAGAEYLVLNARDTSKRSLVSYVFRVARLVQRLRPQLVIYLGSQTASTALLTSDQRSAVYWNEHPSHYLPPLPWIRHPLKALTNLVLRELTYLGARKSELVMPIGEAHLEDLLARGTPRDCLLLLYMGVDKMFQRPTQQSCRRACGESEPLRLVYTGSVAHDRGRDVMLEGISLANREAVLAHLTIIGASLEQVSYCRKRAEEFGIAEQIEVMPRVAGDVVPSLLADADLGVCIWEDRIHWRFNPPTKLFEYLVAGLPVLASDIRTHTRYISNWVNGRIFQYSAVSFAEAIRELAARRAELPALKRNAIASGQKYLWEHIEPEFLNAAGRIVKGRSSVERHG